MYCSHCGFKLTDGAKFCSSCGEKQPSMLVESAPSADPPSATSTLDQAEPVEFAKQVRSYMWGSLADGVESKFCEIVKAKKFNDVLCNVVVSKDAILVSPHSRDRGGLALAGLVLTGGAGLIGALGMSAGAALAQLFSDRQSESLQGLLKNLENTLVLNASTLKVKAYDYRSSWDLGGGEWETRISIHGDGFFNGLNGDCAVVFSVPGKTYERTLLCKANNKVPELARILGISVPDIPKETKFVW